MKVKRYRLYGCLTMICAIGRAVSIGTSVANNKMPLSDDAMSSVYGGQCETGPCDWDMAQGCNTPTGNEFCNSRDVSPTSACTSPDFKQSCKRDQGQCSNGNEGNCTEPTPSCPTEVSEKKCIIVDDECRTGTTNPNPITCGTSYSTYQDCDTQQ